MYSTAEFVRDLLEGYDEDDWSTQKGFAPGINVVSREIVSTETCSPFPFPPPSQRIPTAIGSERKQEMGKKKSYSKALRAGLEVVEKKAITITPVVEKEAVKEQAPIRVTTAKKAPKWNRKKGSKKHQPIAVQQVVGQPVVGGPSRFSPLNIEKPGSKVVEKVEKPKEEKKPQPTTGAAKSGAGRKRRNQKEKKSSAMVVALSKDEFAQITLAALVVQMIMQFFSKFLNKIQGNHNPSAR